jgi:hypothetical protein
MSNQPQHTDPPQTADCPSAPCSALSDAEKYADPSGPRRMIGCSQERVEEQLRIALDGHPDSELWGENGLIAATMRAARVASTLEDVIQKFRDEEEYLLLDKSSRALGGAIAYGAMADELSKLIQPNVQAMAAADEKTPPKESTL